MKPNRSDHLAALRSVRQTVWPWDAPAAVAWSRPLWQRVVIQLSVMGVLAGVFFLFGHVIMPRIILGLAVIFVLLARFAVKVGAALTHLLLLPFYWICFVPARAILCARRKDPLHRAFPEPNATCWQQRPKPREAETYRRQY